MKPKILVFLLCCSAEPAITRGWREILDSQISGGNFNVCGPLQRPEGPESLVHVTTDFL